MSDKKVFTRRLELGALLLLTLFSAPAAAEEIEVSAATPASVVWTVPVRASAGEPFTVKLEIRDRFGNLVRDFDRRGITFDLRTLGRGSIQPAVVLPRDFRDGVAELEMAYQVAERVELVAKMSPPPPGARAGEIEFRSPPFNVTAGRLSELRMVAPSGARAGTPFRVTISAIDAFGNVIKDFKERTSGVILSSDGFGLLSPMRVSPAAFTDGMADVTLTYTGTGEITLIAKDPATEVSARTGTKIKMGSGDPVRFQVTAPPQARVDESFDVAVTVMDAFGNVVTDYNLIGTFVLIATDGSGSIPNNQIPADRFVNGVAFFKITYNKPESISLIVTEPGTARTGASAPIAVQPGRVSRLDVLAPPRAEAGKPFSVRIRTLDARGNVSVIPMNKVLLYVYGSVVTSPIEIPGTVFKGGEAERKISYNVAEEISVSAQIPDGAVRSDPARVTIRPGPAASAGISAPSIVTAGAGIVVKLTALDEFRNVAEDFDKGQAECRVRVEGPGAPPATEVSAEEFVKGAAEVTLNYFQAGTVRVAAELMGRKTTSNPVDVLPAALHHFELDLPAQAQAGSAFRLTLRAKDAFNNTVADYTRIGNGVQLHSSGVSEVQPAMVMPGAFEKGVALVDLVSYAAERVTLTATERFGSAAGQSGPMMISSGALDHFLVSAAPRVRAGDKFPLRIEAQDMYYNLVKNFSTAGPIRLTTSGKGSVQPPQITAAQFSNGVAFLQASVNAAGSVELVAATDDRKAAGRSNPMTILPSAASSYKVDVLEAVTAGEPFRVRVSALDAFGNPVEDMKGVRRPIRLGSGKNDNGVVPSALSPELFSQGMAEAYLVVPRAGRVTVQVREGVAESAGWMPSADRQAQIEGMYFKTYGAGSDRTDIYLVSTGPIEYRVSEPTHYGDGLDALVLTMPNASLQREMNYDALDLPGLKAAKLSAYTTADVPSTPRLMLKMDSRYAYSVHAQANILVLALSHSGVQGAPTFRMPTAPTSMPSGVTIPSLQEINDMVNRGDYKTARRAVELFLSAHPGHPEANALRVRLEKVLRLLGE